MEVMLDSVVYLVLGLIALSMLMGLVMFTKDTVETNCQITDTCIYKNISSYRQFNEEVVRCFNVEGLCRVVEWSNLSYAGVVASLNNAYLNNYSINVSENITHVVVIENINNTVYVHG